MSASIRRAIRTTGASTTCNRQREHVERFGLTLDMVQLPLSSRPIEEAQSPQHPAGQGSGAPARDRFDLPADRADRRGRHSGGEIQLQHHRHPAHRARAGTRRLAQRGVPLARHRPVGGTGPRRRGERGGELGAHRHIPRRRGAGGRDGEGAAGVPSARPLHAARLQGRHPRAGHGGRACSAS